MGVFVGTKGERRFLFAEAGYNMRLYLMEIDASNEYMSLSGDRASVCAAGEECDGS
jgi:hypothetical protein